MKNIHIIPTDQPSRLIIYSTLLNDLRLLDEPNSDWKHKRHIYITSNEEIKEGDWFVTDDKRIEKCAFDWKAREWHKKIILTTDEDLIKDGVQAIDDEFLEWFVKNEFLEWFVKNPTCEFIEVKRDFADEGVKGITYYGKYFVIIIPQEEPKQYPMGSFAPGNYWHKECVTCKKEFMGDKKAVQCESCAIKMTQEEPKQEYVKCTCTNSLEYSNCSKKCERVLAEQEEPKQDLEKEMFELEQELDIPSSMRWHNSKPKQETLEEAAEKYIETSAYMNLPPIDFIKFGAKWQAERMYMEEKIFYIATKVLTEEYSDFPANDWHYEREFRMLVKAMNLLINH
jgi:hypothetical protein